MKFSYEEHKERMRAILSKTTEPAKRATVKKLVDLAKKRRGATQS